MFTTAFCLVVTHTYLCYTFDCHCHSAAREWVIETYTSSTSSLLLTNTHDLPKRRTMGVNLMGHWGGGRRLCLWSKIWKCNSHNWPR